MSFDWTELPLWVNLLIFACGGAVVWLSGLRLSQFADAISDLTGMSKALAGSLLLGVATSLPEVTTTVTAGALRNADLAIGNLLGGVSMQLAVLALVDLCAVRGALTYFSPKPVVLLGGILLIAQIALATIAFASGDITLFAHLGCWPVILVLGYLASLYIMQKFGEREPWMAAELPEYPEKGEIKDRLKSVGDEELSLFWLSVRFVVACLFVLSGGVAVTTSADAIATQTGMGSSFIAATLVATTTSLPEISTTFGAIRINNFTMAISNIFGTNSLEVALLFLADLAYLQGPIMNDAGGTAQLLNGTGIIMTCCFLWGMLERRNRTFAGMGHDSALATGLYLCALILLYFQS